MIKVTIIGSGNVAQHLIGAFVKSNAVEIVQVYSRKKQSIPALPDFEKITDRLDNLDEADLYIIAVSDNAIAEVATKLPFKNRLVVHTSGSFPLDGLHENNRRGVFYPLQTFTKGKAVDFSNLPICLETEFGYDYIILDSVAKSISEKVYTINSEQRKSLHVSAVFVNNFVNHLYEIGYQICTENQVSFDILKPLIAETAEKIVTLSPDQAQTGPAKRHDSNTINSHLDFLTNENQKNIYRLLTQSIQEHGKKL
ncbi:MAG: F420-dependent NADP oxidoreductase [Flavobacterium sp.]|nr:F420-dependent NADP oxidoreductase [Flavobacterium sp.]